MYFWLLSCFRYYLDFVTGVIGDNNFFRLTAPVVMHELQFGRLFESLVLLWDHFVAYSIACHKLYAKHG